jgi:hypothetical protein
MTFQCVPHVPVPPIWYVHARARIRMKCSAPVHLVLTLWTADWGLERRNVRRKSSSLESTAKWIRFRLPGEGNGAVDDKRVQINGKGHQRTYCIEGGLPATPSTSTHSQ